MAFQAATAANSLLQRAFKERRTDMTPMKVQKLLYFLNGWHLAITGEPAVHEPFEVWKYGPVIPCVYQGLKQFADGPVTSYIKTLDPATFELKAFVASDSAKEFQEVLDLTWEKYIGIDALSLSAMTHAPDSPWSAARRKAMGTIPNESIKDYFIGLARTTRSQPAASHAS